MTASPDSAFTNIVKQGSGESASENGFSRKSTRRPVACKSCHSLKVKCTPADINNPGGPCIRCLNARRVCEIDLNQPRKRRKKAEIQEEREARQKSEETRSATPVKHNSDAQKTKDDTINELREQVKKLRDQLSHKHPHSLTWTDSPSSESTSSFICKPDLEDELRILAENGNDTFSKLTTQLKNAATSRYDFIAMTRYPIDLISKNIITLKMAEERLAMYHDVIYENFPYVEISKDLTAQELAKTQPFLFNAVMAVTNVIYHEANDSQAQIIDTETTRAIATEVFVAGNKSEELLKAILLLCLWYNTPELFRQRRYHLINSIAICMVHDLGIVARCTYYHSGEAKFKLAPKMEATIEQRRLVLMLYVSTVTICLILRRSIYVKWTPYIQDCCLLLEKSTDEKLVEMAVFARLNFQLERIHSMIHSPEISLDMSPNNQYLIRELQRNLNTIKDTINPTNHALLAYYYSVEAYLHEPVLSQVLESFKENEDVSLSETSIRAITKCTTSCLNALIQFTTLGSEKIPIVPLIYIARIIYTGGMLLRLRYLILSLPSHIEKDLVPRTVISVIQKLNNVMLEVTTKNPNNYSVKKTSLMFQLFIQTYSTQIQQLLNREGDTPENFKPLSKNLQDRAGLVSSDLKILRQPVSLDILSYAAAFRKDREDKGSGSIFGPEENKILSFHSAADYARLKLDNAVSEIPDNRSDAKDNKPPIVPQVIPQLPKSSYATPSLNTYQSQTMSQPVNGNGTDPSSAVPPVNFIPSNRQNPQQQPSQQRPEAPLFPTVFSNDEAAANSNIANPLEYDSFCANDVWNISEDFWSDILNPSTSNFNLENKRNTAMTDDIFYMRS